MAAVKWKQLCLGPRPTQQPDTVCPRIQLTLPSDFTSYSRCLSVFQPPNWTSSSAIAETALQGGLVMAKTEDCMELGDNISRRLDTRACGARLIGVLPISLSS